MEVGAIIVLCGMIYMLVKAIDWVITTIKTMIDSLRKQ